ncbi:HlyD family secretion protein [Fimbriiglobus ruber]|uniref:Membrane fusion component of tripartite multidrug resistance system n=1 Tax=Fimbriiglobus ruber TaxID=1908690 RepID=A0A225DDS5_9BACT|nr:efflux RND transporter periplasmic adaptor subunit [Fimbriiglobus ruber]OWK36668.1 Membrane fusion component of tripartite multidrug resistance system [Fimbriiglobus ruber]
MSDLRTAPGIQPNGELLTRVKQLRLDEQLGAAKSGRGGGAGWLPWVLCALLAFAWATAGIRAYRAVPHDGTAAATGQSATTAPVTAASDSAKSVEAGTIQLEVKGYLVPARQISVSPIDVGGRLIALDVVEGRRYEAGAVLGKLDPASYTAVYEETVASQVSAQKRLVAAEQHLAELLPASVRPIEITQVEAQLREAEAQRARAEDEQQRLSPLKGASGREINQAQNDLVGAKARVEKLRADLVVLREGPRKEKVLAAEADVAAARADVLAADARMKQNKWRLDNCVIRAPVTGTVLSKKAENGNLVNPMAFGASSGSICDMADLSDLEVDLEIPERDIAKLKVDQPCRIKVDAYPDRPYTGRLDRIMPIANRSKSIVNVRVKVQLPANEEPGTYLKPEMGAVVSFLPMTEKKVGEPQKPDQPATEPKK